MSLKTALSSVHLVSMFGGLLVALTISGCGSVSHGVPASEGILNFGRVNGALFRGAQPDERGMASVARLGVRTIINLRLAADTWRDEETFARAHGLGYFSVPLRGLGAPTDAQVAQVLALIESSPPPVFVHCEHGADRTGTIIACYRMRHDGWTVDQALAEAKLYGLSVFQVGMRRYIREFLPAASSPPAHSAPRLSSSAAPAPPVPRP